MAEKLHPVVALRRTIGRGMSVREFAEWYQQERMANPKELFEFATMAAEELGAELDDSEAAPEAGSRESNKIIFQRRNWNRRNLPMVFIQRGILLRLKGIRRLYMASKLIDAANGIPDIIMVSEFIKTLFLVGIKNQSRLHFMRHRPMGLALERTIKPVEPTGVIELCFYCKRLPAKGYCGVCMKHYCQLCAHKGCEVPSGLYS